MGIHYINATTATWQQIADFTLTMPCRCLNARVLDVPLHHEFYPDSSTGVIGADCWRRDYFELRACQMRPYTQDGLKHSVCSSSKHVDASQPIADAMQNFATYRIVGLTSKPTLTPLDPLGTSLGCFDSSQPPDEKAAPAVEN